MKTLIFSLLIIISFTSCEDKKATKVVEIEEVEEKEEYRAQADLNIGSYESYLRAEKEMFSYS